MQNLLTTWTCVVIAALTLAPFGVADDANHQREFETKIRPLLTRYCFDCHGDLEAEAGVNLERDKTIADIQHSHRQWKKVLLNLQHSKMPPKDSDQPTTGERKIIAAWLQEAVIDISCVGEPKPGAVTIRRLNAFEYRNTIRDLMGVDYKPAKDFPGDDVGYGFDNIGDVLSLPPLLMEKYLDAAESIADEAIEKRADGHLVDRKIPGPSLKTTRGGSGNGVLSSHGELWFEFEIATAGEYTLSARAYGDQAGDEPAKMEIRVDGKGVKKFDVPNQKDKPGDFSAEGVKIAAGKHKIGIAFLNDYYEPNAKDRNRRDRNLHAIHLQLQGPTDFDSNSLPQSHRDILFVTPDKDRTTREAAEQILKRFVSRAYRRPATESEVKRLVDLAATVARREKSFTAGIHFAVQAVLVSPHFLFKVEQPPKQGEARTLSDYELASNLSYFLWSSMPDDELRSLADRGELRKNGNFRKQVTRMLNDEKANALVESFSGQWLQLRSLEDISPDVRQFPNWNDKLAADMKMETELFFGSIIRENRPITDLLEADYTFLNQRLAEHYDFNDVNGNEFRKVSLNGSVRGGILTHASILTVTSNPTRTSPVKRGKWVLENLLGEPPPPPAPDVMELEDQAELTGTLREKMEQHRADPACASCHAQMDPIGFALENFDPIGGWRVREGNDVIDASGKLPAGDEFTGAIELQRILTTRLKEKFVRTFTEKLLTYSLGRGLTYYDQCAVNEIVKASQNDKHRFASLVMALVESTPFQQRSRPE